MYAALVSGQIYFFAAPPPHTHTHTHTHTHITHIHTHTYTPTPTHIHTHTQGAEGLSTGADIVGGEELIKKVLFSRLPILVLINYSSVFNS